MLYWKEISIDRNWYVPNGFLLIFFIIEETFTIENNKQTKTINK